MKKKYHLILSIILPCISMLWAFLYYKILFNNHALISLDDISTNVFNISLQHIIVNLPIIILFVITAKMMGRKKLFFNLPSKKIWKVFLALCTVIYFILFFYALSVNHNMIKVLYTAIFYLFFVSFMEEYLYRGLIPALQKNKLPKILEWIVPNLLFTISHYIVLFVDTSKTSGVTIFNLAVFFITTIIFGVVMEFLKRKSNSLYVGILVHTIYDFYGEIMIWL